MLKGGMIGFGTSGVEFTEYINKSGLCNRARIVAACNRGKPNLDVAASQYGLRVTHDVDEMCSWDLDFVFVASTSYAHKAQVETAARHGLHVFCEKPIALNMDDAYAMVDAVEKAGVQSVVNYGLRYSMRTRTIQHIIERGELGDILSVTYEHGRGFGLYSAGARHRAIIEPEESGGWIVHHCCHQVDLIYNLFGEYKEVYCRTRSTVPDKESEEVIFANGILKNGTMFHVSDSMAKMGYNHLVITGTKGSYAWQNASPYSFDRLRGESWKGEETMSYPGGWIVCRDMPHTSVDHFFDCIEGKSKPLADLRSSLESLRVCLAMRESARTGKIIDLTTYGKR